MKKILFISFFLTFSTVINAQCWQSISAGYKQSYAIKNDGTLWAWGYNLYGQLGDGSTSNKNIPTQIGTEQDWQSISSGTHHTIGIKSNGTIWAWGRNNNGQLGDGTTISKYTPIQIGNDNNWQSIATGAQCSFAIKNNGTLWAWGANIEGQLGDGTYTNKLTPIQIGSDTNWIKVTAGQEHTLALKNNGTLWAWGNNYFGQIGNGTSFNHYNLPQQVNSITNCQFINAANDQSFIIKTDGTLWAWGYNESGQLGNGTFNNSIFSPTIIGSDTNWQSVEASTAYTIAKKTNGTIFSWGDNSFGQLGDGTTVDKLIPTQIGTLSNWQIIATGYGQSLSLKNDGTLSIWGWNDQGQLGDGTTVDKHSPIIITCNTLGISEETVKTFLIYPNPTMDVINFLNNENYTIEKITITDITGKKVYEHDGNNSQINIQNINQGMYFLNVFSEGKIYPLKFIKK